MSEGILYPKAPCKVGEWTPETPEYTGEFFPDLKTAESFVEWSLSDERRAWLRSLHFFHLQIEEVLGDASSRSHRIENRIARAVPACLRRILVRLIFQEAHSVIGRVDQTRLLCTPSEPNPLSHF